MAFDHKIRTELGRRLMLARRGRGLAVHAAGKSGVGYRVIDRVETARNESVWLETVYLLAQHYGVSMGHILGVEFPPGLYLRVSELGTWPENGPSFVEVDAHVRTALRRSRIDAGLGTPTLATAAGVHQTWIVRIESGELARCDLIRLARCCHALSLPLRELLPPEHRGETNGDRFARVSRPFRDRGANPGTDPAEPAD